MQDTKKPTIKITYKDDEETKNKFISFIINLILENNYLLGDLNVTECKGNTRQGDSRHDY